MERNPRGAAAFFIKSEKSLANNSLAPIQAVERALIDSAHRNKDLVSCREGASPSRPTGKRAPGEAEGIPIDLLDRRGTLAAGYAATRITVFVAICANRLNRHPISVDATSP
jgi:hypothetical protein